MVKFIKVNDIPTYGSLIIPVQEMLKLQSANPPSATYTEIRYGTTNTSINIIGVSHAAMTSASDTAMKDWLTKQFIAANQRPWSEPMYNVSASDAPYSISNIVLS